MIDDADIIAAYVSQFNFFVGNMLFLPTALFIMARINAAMTFGVFVPIVIVVVIMVLMFAMCVLVMMLVLVGGIIPDMDIPKLNEIGVRGIFLPGTTMRDIVDFIDKNTPSRVETV